MMAAPLNFSHCKAYRVQWWHDCKCCIQKALLATEAQTSKCEAELITSLAEYWIIKTYVQVYATVKHSVRTQDLYDYLNVDI
jgi:hypothetical protein